jgi:hypothetical protein
MPQSVEGSGSIDLTAPAPQQATANPPDAETLPKKPQNIFLATRYDFSIVVLCGSNEHFS